MLCVFSRMIVVGYVFRSNRWGSLGNNSLILTLLHIPNFRSPCIGVEVIGALTSLFVWGIRGDFMIVFQFLWRCQSHEDQFQQLQRNAHSLAAPVSCSGV